MRTTCRAFHLVDIENLLALTHGQPVGLGAGAFYGSVAGVQPEDLVTVGADQSRVFDIRSAFPAARVCSGRGADGADLALINSIDLDHIARRFDTIVIGSGDHRFLDVVYRARQRSLKVVVVSRRSSLSRALASYADIVIDVPLVDVSLGDVSSVHVSSGDVSGDLTIAA